MNQQKKQISRRTFLRKATISTSLLAVTASCDRGKKNWLAYADEERLIPCHDCNDCMPCPYGLDIPGNFDVFNQGVREGLIMESTSDSDYRLRRNAFLHLYDTTLSPRRNASHCIGCGKCLGSCPHNIVIPASMLFIDEYVEALRQDTLSADEEENDEEDE